MAVAPTEVLKIFNLFHPETHTSSSALVIQIDSKLRAIAEREQITIGGTIDHIQDDDGISLLYIAAKYGRIGKPPPFIITCCVARRPEAVFHWAIWVA